ncbi:D-Ala-D-Ala carboxypeptidase family metallohydrolase [uncultured Bartonella sp.]|uniref:YcbK family protein n=1 Tax=uncultured Bartonella sp. TaxID=104108 RepID=UPI00260CF565|nr:D-Ala-D-Ala carboxypeptidase family metallohydrolase [uncultured Bartonella sp.]
MLANTDILPYKIKYRGFSLPDLVRAGLWLSLAVMFCGCTSNLAGLATVGKTAQQAAENTSEQQSARENSSTTAVPAEQGVNQAANVPVPTPPPLAGQQATIPRQANAIDDNKTAKPQETILPSQITKDQQTQNPPITQEASTKRTALFPFIRKKDSSAPSELPTGESATNTRQAADVAAQSMSTTDNVQQQTTNEKTAPPAPQAISAKEDPKLQMPERDATSQKKGSLMRLFGHANGAKQDKSNGAETRTALVPLPKKDTHEYNDALPGVRPNGGIVIKHRTSLYDDTDIDANEIDSPSLYTLASVSLYGRSLPNGLKIARKDVEVSCLKPQLVTILKTIERRFNKPVIITSGYRSPTYNQKVNGAKRSMHMSCAAADIQVPETNKWDVAKFVRALPNRGGVGTYCHQSIHVDIGPKRDWNWSCSAKN